MNIEWQRQQAKNENTAPEVLEELANSKDYLTRQYVVANPNTPTNILLSLGAEFPRELINNPLFDLLILEDIDFINKIPNKTLSNILREQDCPEFILERASDRAELEVQLSLANKVTTSKKILSRLVISKYLEVVEAANLHINYVGEINSNYLIKAQEVITNKISSDRQYKTTIQLYALFFQLVSIPDFFVKALIDNKKYSSLFKIIARSPALSSQVISLIVEYGNKNIITLFSYNPNLTTEIIDLLVDKVTLWSTQKAIAASHRVSTDALDKLSTAKDNSVRASVASNLNTSLSTLNKLIQDSSDTVVKRALRNIAIQTNKYNEFLKNHGSTMFIRGSDNDETSYQIPLDILTNLALENPYFVAEYPHTHKKLLIELSYHRRWDIRNKVAANKNTPVAILKELAKDTMLDVRYSVARNINTPLNIIFEELIRDVRVSNNIIYQLCDATTYSEQKIELENIRDILAEESDSDLETIIERIIDYCGVNAKVFLAKRADLPQQYLIELAQRSQLKIQQAVANNPHTPSSSLEHLANTNNKELKKAIAKHPNTPDYVLEILAWDENQLVRAAAMTNQNLTLDAIEQILCGNNAAEYPHHNPDYAKNHPHSLGVVLNYYARCQYPLIRYLALLQPQVSTEILAAKSLSVVWCDRFAVGQNNNTPKEVLDKLTKDCNQLVRAAARDNLEIRK